MWLWLLHLQHFCVYVRYQCAFAWREPRRGMVALSEGAVCGIAERSKKGHEWAHTGLSLWGGVRNPVEAFIGSAG